MEENMIDAKGRFVIEDYQKKSVFSGFLPGISGITGIPIWCYYVNRGQCVSCFGSEDKDHSIMEFLPAHQAYVNTARMGYRTFYNINGAYTEAFNDSETKKLMYVGQNTLEIEEEDTKHQLKTNVSYFTLPEEQVGGLVRKVCVQNISDKSISLEVLDGCPAIIPYGVDLDSMKKMTQTSKAWMQVEDVTDKKPFFRVRASMADSSKVVEIEGGNFSVCVDKSGNRLQPIVDTQVIFAHDTAYEVPHNFVMEGLEALYNKTQMTMNQIPCCFYGAKVELKPNEAYTVYQVTGQAANKDIYHKFLEKQMNDKYFEEKLDRAISLTDEITDVIHTKTAHPAFDGYCRQTFLDNVLRGGMPITLGDKEMFYVYARKHGDMERDYNYFRILPEFFSQGNGNFRDINQNRRCDTSFYPQVGDKNIHMFYDFVQLDGYNPLGVEKTTYQLKENQLSVAAEVLNKPTEQLEFLTKPFTPGKLAAFLVNEKEYDEKELTATIGKIVDMADSLVTSDFLEGYWCDHWTYNLDLIENYLMIHPEKEEQLLYDDSYVYMKPGAGIYPRKYRYVETQDGVRQYKAVYHLQDDKPSQKLLADREGRIIHTTLMEKLILLNILKFATLDAHGCGVEMECGKPGWYDALNGLPGLFGSSMPETCELARNLEYTVKALRSFGKDVSLLQELTELMEDIKSVLKDVKVNPGAEYFTVWDKVNAAKEAYREKLYQGVSGEYVTCDAQELAVFLEKLLEIVKAGIDYAVSLGDGLVPTYFSYEVTEYEKKDDAIYAKAFKQHVLPYFLEGPVRILKLSMELEQKQQIYTKVRQSGLYDNKLNMYKVNAPITEESFELGRCRAFTPGWLENESIWLHMEYKYLLELLKSGMYENFVEDFRHCVIAFLDEDTYGRSILENSSFIASSANPDSKIHGKGFVARLSGSTVEFMDMWQSMMFGRTPFSYNEDGMVFALKPLLPDYLLGKNGVVEAMFLGRTKVIYHAKKDGRDYIPGNYQVTEYAVSTGKKQTTHIYGDVIKGNLVEAIRAGEVTQIDVYIE